MTTQSPPQPGATVLFYVATAPMAVNAVLAQERTEDNQKKQLPVYFVSKALTPTKSNYSEIAKIVYAVVMASRKLRHYFQAYNIVVPSAQPLKDILRNREASGRIGKWATELNEYVIDYVHRSTIQSQALADFIVDWTPILQEPELPAEDQIWEVYCDGIMELERGQGFGSHILPIKK